jgi:ubiquinone/menaquinone biosynthesis C-methylase UbiE
MPKINSRRLEKIWSEVPLDYYQKAVKTNLLQATWHKNKLKNVVKLIPRPPKSILDVGCASGWFLSRLKGCFPNSTCTGVDVYQKAIYFGIKTYPRLKLRVADAHNLPFADHSFDLTVSTEVLEHVVNPSRAIREMKRVTVPGGTVIIEMDSGNWLFNSVWFIWTKLKGQVWNEAHIQTFNTQLLIQKTGLKIKKTQSFNLGMAVVFQCVP